MITDPMTDLLTQEGFTEGWALSNGVLIIWEHEQDPPAPLTRPKATDETPSPT
jgi:hypothetical protein